MPTDDEVDEVEEPPYSQVPLSSTYTTPVPFGEPPPEPVTLVGDIPWELTGDEPPTDA